MATDKCSKCGEMKIIKNKGMCSTCFNETYNTKPCKECGAVRIIAGRGLCSSCYHAVLKKEAKEGTREPYIRANKDKKLKKVKDSSNITLCIACGKMKNKYRNEVCASCYKILYRPVKICDKCGELKRILAKGLCEQCYKLENK